MELERYNNAIKLAKRKNLLSGMGLPQKL